MKEFYKSKTNWVAIVGFLFTILSAIDVTKLPPDVQKWAGPMLALLVLVARNWNTRKQ